MSKVSVLLTFYNEASIFFIRAVESILCQTYTDFQFVIVSDNPFNETLNKLAESYAVKDKRILYIKNQRNLGLTKSLNIGLQHCEGDYIARMDADDISMPNRLEKQVTYMIDHPEVIALGSNAYVIDENDQIIGKMRRPKDHKKLVSLAPFVSPIFHPAAMIRRSFSGEDLNYNEKFKYSQDFDLWNTIMFKGKIENLTDYLIKYRKSNNQISSVHRNEQKIIDAVIMANSIKKLFKGLSDDQIMDLVCLCGYSQGSYCMSSSEVELTLFCMYKGNQTNDLVNIYLPINFLIKKYCSWLTINDSFFHAFKRIIVLSFMIKIRPFPYVVFLTKLNVFKMIKNNPFFCGILKPLRSFF